jgi:uncharacterized protein YgiM (DUF1202 family)
MRFFYCLKLCSCAAITISLPGLLVSCSSGSAQEEKAFVSPERLKLKSSTAPAARFIGELKGGDQVTVKDRETAEDGEMWSKVIGPNGESGWIKSLNLVKSEIVEKSRQIAAEIKDIPTQAIGKSNALLNLRLSPDRSDDENVAITLPTGTRFEIVARERKPRPAKTEGKGKAKEDSESNPNANIRYDNWYEVRLKDNAILPAGWVYGDSVELDIPIDIFHYVSSGRRIVGWQKIATVAAGDKASCGHYLALERKISGADEGVDFDRAKLLACDPATRDYSTPFREDIAGRFPVTVKMDGARGYFQIIAVDKDGKTQKLDYSVEMLGGGKAKVAKSVAN